MEKPTIWSNRPDPMRRTVCIHDEHARRARYGRIRPMETRKPLLARLVGIILIFGPVAQTRALASITSFVSVKAR